MDRTILVKVNGHYLIKDNSRAGVQHECNAVRMRIEFDPGWDGLAKKVTFWNAAGKKPVERTLTADLLENMAVNPRAYLCPIPGEAMEIAGDMTFIIDGYVDGKRQRSLSGTLRVEAAPFIERAGEPADPTPTQAEQLQVQIDAVMGDLQRAIGAADEAAACAEAAAVSESNAVASEQAAGQHVIAAQKSADEAEIAEAGAKAAQKAAETARDEAQHIAGGEFAPLKHAGSHATGGSDPLTPANIGAVSLAGDTMTDDLRISKQSYPQLSLIDIGKGRRFRVIGGEHGALRNSKDDANYRALSISPETSDIKSALRLTQNAGGVWSEYNVLHTGNKSLIAPEDIGAVNKAGDTMTGNLVIRKSGPTIQFKDTVSGGEALIGNSDKTTYIHARDVAGVSENRRQLSVFSASKGDIANAVKIIESSNATGQVVTKEYAVLHTGNKSLIAPGDIGAVSKAGDTMTGTLRVASNGGNIDVATNSDHALLTFYKDGGWDGRRSIMIRDVQSDSDMTKALSLGVVESGAWNEYPFIHTGNLHLLDSLLGGAKVKVGSYLGSGTYGGSSPNSIQLDFEPDMVIVQDAGMSGAMVWGMWMRGCLMFMSPSTNYSSFVQDSGKNFKWASTASAAGQFNSSGVAYGYMAISFR